VYLDKAAHANPHSTDTFWTGRVSGCNDELALYCLQM
jgi:hypothetical protein